MRIIRYINKKNPDKLIILNKNFNIKKIIYYYKNVIYTREFVKLIKK